MLQAPQGDVRPNNLGSPRKIYNPNRIRTLYIRDTSRGANNRKLLKATLPLGTYNTFTRFLDVYADGGIRRGSGIGSPMVAVALNLLIAVSTGHGMGDVAGEIGSIVTDEEASEEIKKNLKSLSELL